jgi:hypothetical protein
VVPTIGLADLVMTSTNCQGEGPYSDLVPGTAVVVTGPQGQVLGTGALGEGVPDMGTVLPSCVLPFSVSDIPLNEASYSVTVSHRGTQVFTPDVAHAGIGLTIGSN